MTRIVHAQLVRLLRPRTVAALAGVTVVFATLAGLTVFAAATADPAVGGGAAGRGSVSLSTLESASGGTEAFAVAASFTGFLVFVTFIALIATEFSGGTWRSLLLRDPHRRRVLVGTVVAILLLAAGTVALAELLTFAVSWLVAPANGVSTAEWFTADGLTSALGNYLTVLAGVTGWAIFGTTLAVVFRSAPLALGVGFAWAGPFENIVVDSWSTGYRLFPGQVLASLIRGGTVELTMGRALATALLYVGGAALLALTIVSRRDVTA
jgi:hypothetical protein